MWRLLLIGGSREKRLEIAIVLFLPNHAAGYDWLQTVDRKGDDQETFLLAP